MTATTNQAYLRARLAVLDSRRRTPEQLRELVALPRDELLQLFGVQASAQELSARGAVLFEQVLMQRWLNELSVLLRPLDGAARELLVQWARRYEVLNLKALIRGKLGGLSRRQIEDSLFDLPGFLRLDHETLLNTDDIKELLRRLQGTAYGSLARTALSRFENGQDPFLLDATLDQRFYSNLGERVARLGEPDRSELRVMVGRIIDRHNLVWLMRYRFNYGLPPAEAVYLSISGGYRLDALRLRAVADAQSLEEALAALPPALQRLTAECQSIVGVEDCLVRDIQQRAEHARRHSPSVLGSVFAYLILRFYELKTTQAIVLGKIRGYPDEVLREALFPLLKEAA